MAINDYLGERAQSTQRGVSRRKFLAGLVALTAGAYVPSNSYSAEPVVQAKVQGLEGKIPSEYEADRTLLTEQELRDENARTEYNQLAVEYMEILMKKGKYDPERKKVLKSEIGGVGNYDLKFKVEDMRKNLLREKDPESYIKSYIKDPERIKRIRKTTRESFLDEFCKLFHTKPDMLAETMNKGYPLPWKYNPCNLDLSDKIYLEDKITGFQKVIKSGCIIMPISGIGTISGNPLVR